MRSGADLVDDPPEICAVAFVERRDDLFGERGTNLLDARSRESQAHRAIRAVAHVPARSHRVGHASTRTVRGAPATRRRPRRVTRSLSSVGFAHRAKVLLHAPIEAVPLMRNNVSVVNQQDRGLLGSPA